MNFKIKAQKNVFDDNFLNVIGNEFKFDHVKGIAEWMKNSADAYTREQLPDEAQFIFLRFIEKSSKAPTRIECIDFIGMTKENIDRAFKRWGDPRAAAQGTGRRVLGGHGNGGKFYMRQMFARSQFITYRNGKLNVFGFDDNKRYGYAADYDDKKMSAADALTFARLSGLSIPAPVRDRWAKSSEGVGFTVVIGEAPEKFKAGRQVDTICQRLKIHPQSRRLVKHKEVFVMMGEEQQGAQLLPEEIPPREGFEGPFKTEIPATMEHEGEKYVFRNKKYPEAYVILYTAKEPFARMGDRAALNSIDILGEVGCIGSYRLNELGYLRYSPQAEFLYGECYCPILEDPSDDCVKNDREKLVDADKTKALLHWVRQQVDAVCEKMADQERKERKKADLRQSSDFNELLNSWKNRFMNKLFAEVLGGPGKGDSVGGGGGGGGAGGRGKGQGTGTSEAGGDGDNGGGAGTQPKKAPRFPRVLLSSYHADPLHPELNAPLDLDPRHPPVHQRHEDVAEGIYWINTSRPLAQRIIEQYKVKSTRFREYLFQRYVDIIVKEAIYTKAKKEANLTAEIVDDLIVSIVKNVHDAAAQDLEQFLFEENFGFEMLPGGPPAGPAKASPERS